MMQVSLTLFAFTGSAGLCYQSVCIIHSDWNITALDEGLPTHLIDRLKAIVSHMEGYDPPGVQSAGGEGMWGLLDPCIGCLLVLVTLNSEVREWLGRKGEGEGRGGDGGKGRGVGMDARGRERGGKGGGGGGGELLDPCWAMVTLNSEVRELAIDGGF